MTLAQRLTARPRLARIAFNAWPCIRGSGVRVEHVADDWSEIRVRLPLSWRTRNYVGTIFGGSMYAAVDPFLMIMLLRRLGPEYVVWDKAASIRFRRPGSSTLRATFRIDDAEVERVRDVVEAAGGRADVTYEVELVDGDGLVHASIEKVLFVATKQTWRNR